MNKLFLILSAVVLSGCARSYTHVRGDNELEKLLKARHECTSELGGDRNMSCRALHTCLRTKGWLKLSDSSGVVVPPQFEIRDCDRGIR